ncbi:MAG TPA: hypothetical protein VHD61_03610 [Lacunisphaera sp.]|nr:hypothetical protein [Lacunisphaera sp.]
MKTITLLFGAVVAALVSGCTTRTASIDARVHRAQMWSGPMRLFVADGPFDLPDNLAPAAGWRLAARFNDTVGIERQFLAAGQGPTADEAVRVRAANARHREELAATVVADLSARGFDIVPWTEADYALTFAFTANSWNLSPGVTASAGEVMKSSGYSATLQVRVFRVDSLVANRPAPAWTGTLATNWEVDPSTYLKLLLSRFGRDFHGELPLNAK